MNIGEFLIALGVKADTDKLKDFDKGLEDVSKSAEQTSSVVGGLSDKIGKFRGFLGVVSAAWASFTATLAGAWGYFHGTIMQLDELIASGNLLFDVTKEQIEQQKKYKESVETLSKQFGSLRAALALGYLPTMMQMINAVNKFLEANKQAIQNGILKFLDAIKSILQVFVNAVRFIDLIVEKTLGWEKALIVLAVALAWVNRAMILAFVTNPVMWMIAAIAGLLILIDDFMTYLDGGESEFGEFWGGMIKWIDKAKSIWDGFSDGFKSGIKAIGIAVALLSPMFGGLTGTILTLGKAFIWVGKAMAMTPMGMAIVLVGLLVYAIIDLIKWLNGGESQFSALWEAAADVWNKIVDWTSQAIEKMINAVKGFIDDVVSYFSGIYDAIVNPFKSAFDWVSSKWSSLKGLFSSGVDVNVNGRVGSAVSSSTTNRTVNNNITNNGSFNINGASNPNVTANAVGANWNSMTQNNMGGVVKA